MAKPSFLDDDLKKSDKDDKTPKEVVEVIEDPEEPSDDDEESEKDNELAEDESISEGKFTGFDESVGALDTIMARLESIEKRLSQPKTDEIDNMTPEEFNKLAKENPGKALDIAMELKLRQMGVVPNRSQGELMADATKQLAHDTAVRENRAAIVTEFNPEKNKKLHEAAKAIYKQRAGRNITIETDPDAEYDAYVKAIKEDPSLAPTRPSGRRNKMADAQPGSGSTASKNVRLTRSQVEIGRRWDLDMSDPKVARSIAQGAHDADQRRADKLAAKRRRSSND